MSPQQKLLEMKRTSTSGHKLKWPSEGMGENSFTDSLLGLGSASPHCSPSDLSLLFWPLGLSCLARPALGYLEYVQCRERHFRGLALLAAVSTCSYSTQGNSSLPPMPDLLGMVLPCWLTFWSLSQQMSAIQSAFGSTLHSFWEFPLWSAAKNLHAVAAWDSKASASTVKEQSHWGHSCSKMK